MTGADLIAKILKSEGIDFMGVIPFNTLYGLPFLKWLLLIYLKMIYYVGFSENDLMFITHLN